MKSMECGLGFQDLVHFGHFITSVLHNFGSALYIHKQGLVQDYSQRLIEGNIYRQKLSSLRPHIQKLHRLRPHRLNLPRMRLSIAKAVEARLGKAHGLRHYRLTLYGSEAGVGAGGGSNEIIYSSISRKK